MQKFVKYSLLSIFAIALSGCVTHRVGDFTVISTKNINLSSGNLQIGDVVSGQDKSFFGPVYLKSAVDNAIDKDRCVVGLSDAVLSLEAGIGATYIVKGKQIIDKNLPGCADR